MRKIIKFFAPNLKLAKGSRLISALFVGASMAIAAGVIFGANIYYDIDTSKIMVGDTQQATTTQITVTTGITTALTVTQRGTAAAFLATSTSAMTSDIFKITNLGSGYSFIVEDSDTDSYPFVISNSGDIGIGTTTFSGLLTVGTTTPALIVDRTSKVGIATTTPSAQFAVQGNIIGSGNLIVYGTTASSTMKGLTVTGLNVGGAGITNAIWNGTSIALGYGGTGASLTDPDADRILFWDDSAGQSTWLTIGSNLNIEGTTLSGNTSNWQLIGLNAIRPTTTIGIIVNASSTFSGDLTVGNEDLFIDISENKVGIASSTPSDTLAVQGNIIGSGNITIYGTATSTIGGQIAMAGTELKATGGGFTVFLSSAGSLTLQPQSDSDVKVLLGGTGQLKVGSSGQFYIDASGNATTSGNIYASAFITSGANASVRKTGEQIVRGVAPIFGFDLPARCNTSCTGQWATISRTIENTDFFPPVLDGTTRKYRFSIRYADATTTVDSIWQIATSTDNSSYQFTLNATESTNLDQGYATTTNTVSTLPSDNWFLRAKLGGIGGYNLQVYEVLLIGLDEMN